MGPTIKKVYNKWIQLAKEISTLNLEPENNKKGSITICSTYYLEIFMEKYWTNQIILEQKKAQIVYKEINVLYIAYIEEIKKEYEGNPEKKVI